MLKKIGELTDDAFRSECWVLNCSIQFFLIYVEHLLSLELELFSLERLYMILYFKKRNLFDKYQNQYQISSKFDD